MKSKMIWLAGAVALAGVGLGGAGLLTNGLPVAGGTQYPSTIPLTGNETAPFDTNLTNGQNPASEAISTLQMAGYISSGPSKTNALIGGDATTNLFQRGTTGSSVTTTVTYGGPDRWAYWSGTSTAMTVSRDATAADLPVAFKYGFIMQRTAAQTGVVQMCMAQEIESVNAYQFQGQVAELDFHAFTGANFSPASPFNMTAYIIYGTGQDEGMTNLAFGLNGGGGGSSGWTGQGNAAADVVPLGGVSTLGRYAAIGVVPSTATEVAVALCYTPVGTAGTTDAITFSGIQLVRNPSNASIASATIGYSCANISCVAFERRTQALETVMQQRYYWKWAETASATTASPFMCQAQSATVAICKTILPAQLRVAPTVACTPGTLKRQVAGTDTTVSACAAAATTNGVSDVNSLNITATVASGDTAGFASSLMSGNSTGGGVITASAEL